MDQVWDQGRIPIKMTTFGLDEEPENPRRSAGNRRPYQSIRNSNANVCGSGRNGENGLRTTRQPRIDDLNTDQLKDGSQKLWKNLNMLMDKLWYQESIPKKMKTFG